MTDIVMLVKVGRGEILEKKTSSTSCQNCQEKARPMSLAASTRHPLLLLFLFLNNMLHSFFGALPHRLFVCSSCERKSKRAMWSLSAGRQHCFDRLQWPLLTRSHIMSECCTMESQYMLYSVEMSMISLNNPSQVSHKDCKHPLM